MEYINKLLVNRGVNENITKFLSFGILTLIVILTCFLVHFIIKKVIFKYMTRIVKRTKYEWDDLLLNSKLFDRVANFVPGIIIYNFAPAFPDITVLIERCASVYILIVLALMINELLDVVNNIYRTYPISRVRPITGFLQVVKIVTFSILGIILIANFMNESPLILLSGIGAFAAVFSFVFKDTILGFIAGIQLTTNDMLRIGDWIEMEKYGADGDVIDIALNTIKVQNFDKTIVTIPAYAFVSDSFKNWRGMKEYGGRRIKRSLYIDVNSIGFCTPEMIEKFKKIHYLEDYITQKENEIREYNKVNEVNTELLVNGRHMTNIGTFRAYIINYIKNHPGLQGDATQIVRQLPPGEYGLPLEIYAFTNTTDWATYENIQSDIFDHIISVAGEFGLRLFQNPSGYDVRKINIGGPN
ncbi:MAG TPA: mechanosensitive ion channel protein MscS [Lachnospiraceae bacterium]|jgi:miniconductance mechanosensitive channel|nr:mechanosensitive ion channel protein MscS [Lachnospiraceae bacterium]